VVRRSSLMLKEHSSSERSRTTRHHARPMLMSGAFEGSKRRAEGHRTREAKRTRNGEANERARGRPAGAAGTRPSYGGEGAGAKRPGRPKSPNPPQETLNHHYSARRDAQGSHGRMGLGGMPVGGGVGVRPTSASVCFPEGCNARAG
jgi:hypothetical protein